MYILFLYLCLIVTASTAFLTLYLLPFLEYGGSKDFPVTLFQLPKLASNEFKLQKGSRHKLMIENALQIAIESLIFSGNISHTFSGCPLEITKVK